MTFGCAFCGEMAEAVNEIESRVNFAGETKIGHVSNDSRRLSPSALEPFVTEIDRMGIEVISGDVISRFCHFDQQTPRPAGGLEHPPYLPGDILLETGGEKSKFRFPVRRKYDVIVGRIIVDFSLNDFRHAD